MRILRNAVEEEAATKKVQCTTCTSDLEVMKEDVTFHSDQRDGSSFSFVCPVCHQRTLIDADQFPKNWRIGAKRAQ